MMSLPDGWESDYDGTRWLFRYKATGMVQYHFPQPGDEYAEFLLDAGIGPIQLSPEESLAIEQQTRQKGIHGQGNDTKNGTKPSGSKREKTKIEDSGGEYGMSATGYFDPMYFPGAYNSISPLGEDDGEETIELPGDGQQMRSPVGYVAELATQDTLKCAEELAPVELDGTSFTPAPIQTNMRQEPAELPTHRTPVEEKTPDPKLAQPVMQLVDSSALTSASFAYTPSNPNIQPINDVPPRASSIKRKPVSSGTNLVGRDENKYQPFKPTPGKVEHPSQAYNMATEPLPQTSVLQNQNSELGIIDQKNSGNKLPVPGSIPSALMPPSAPNKLAPVETPIKTSEASSVPMSLQPAHRPAADPVTPATNHEQFIPGTQAKLDNTSVSATDHNLSYTPSILKPGGRKPDDRNDSLEESEGSPKPRPPHFPGQNPQEIPFSHRLSEHMIQVSSSHDQPSVTKVNTFPTISNHGTTASPEEPIKPTFPPDPSDSSWINSQSHISVNEQISVVAPLNFIKRHSSKSSQVSSIVAENQDSSPHSEKPVLTPSDEISEVISLIGSFTPQTTSPTVSRPSQPLTHVILGDTNKPVPSSISEGMIGRPDIAPNARPQSMTGQSRPPVTDMQHSSTVPQAPELTSPVAANISKPIAVNATAMIQTTVISSPSNIGIPTTQGGPKIQDTHHSSPLSQGSSIQNPNPSPSAPPQIGTPGRVSVSPGPLRPQGNPSTPLFAPSPPSQTSSIQHTNQAHQLGAHNNYTSNMTQRPPQAPQVNMPISNVNGAAQVPATASVPQTMYQPHRPNNPSPNSIAGPSTAGHSQVATQKPNFQHAATTGPSSHQSAGRPPVGYQISGGVQISSQLPHQNSPVTQTVSPIQSQVSSPAQSIASLHISQASTPSNTFATMNPVPSSNNGPNASINQTTAIPVRPSSVPAHTPTQQVGNAMPHVNAHSASGSVAGTVNVQSIPTAPPPAKPFPMLPGQVTPLPSQVGPAHAQSPMQQPIHNNYAKPTFNTQQAAAGQQPTHIAPGGLTGHYAMPGQVNPTSNPPPGNAIYGQVSSQTQMKPPQQPASSSHLGATHAAGHQPLANQLQPQSQQTASYPSSIASGQAHNPQTTVPPSAGSLPVAGQNTFAPPPVLPVTVPQAKPFTSTQASVALTDAGKGMKKWAKKMLKNPAIKQTGVAISGAFLADSMGVNPGAGAQIANSLYTTATRPPLAHAQTAPPQAHGTPGAAPQHQAVQMGQQYQPVKIQQQPLQQHHQLQPGQPNQPNQPQPARPNQNQPGYSQPGLPQSSYPQSGYSHVAQFKPAYPQPVQQPVGAQALGRPPVVQIQNPGLQAGLAVNLNAQAQAQASFYQQQQRPVLNPVMMNPPPPANQAYGQANIDPTTANAVATMVGSAIGAALRPDPQPQHTYTNNQDHMSHAGSNGAENYGSHAGPHEQVHNSSVPAQTPSTYTDNNYTTADTTYTDNSSYSVNNTYVDNTDVVNNTIIIDNSSTVVTDTTYNNTSYADFTQFSNTDVTNTALSVDVNSAVYTDGNVTAFSMDESINMASTSDVTAVSADYSGDSWGDFSF